VQQRIGIIFSVYPVIMGHSCTLRSVRWHDWSSLQTLSTSDVYLVLVLVLESLGTCYITVVYIFWLQERSKSENFAQWPDSWPVGFTVGGQAIFCGV